MLAPSVSVTESLKPHGANSCELDSVMDSVRVSLLASGEMQPTAYAVWLGAYMFLSLRVRGAVVHAGD